jgi:hypothetical protein
MKLFLSVFFMLTWVGVETFAQDTLSIKVGKNHGGTVYFSWGYNRDWYSKSTIHFQNTKTDNYDFIFYDAVARDKPSMHEWWHLDRLTIPQYDMTGGYMFGDKYDLGIEVSWNHLKYVVVDNQLMHVRGQIRGELIDKDTIVTPSFVHLQHTNGNNYLMVNLVKRQKIWSSKYFGVSAIAKVGAGPLISYTISTVLGNFDSGHFHYHGWVAGTSLGLRFDLYKYLFVQSDMQGAYVDYTNTELGADHQGLATHHFTSLQWIWAFGINVPIGGKKI